MEIKPVRTAKDHKTALVEVERLWNAKPGTAEHDRLDVLVTLIEAYEEKHHAIPPPDPVDAIRFRMDQLDLDRKDLEVLIGSRARVSEVLSGRRSLSLAMIRRLHRRLGIPADILIGVASKARPPRARPGARRSSALKRAS
jgi:HTH-type transcriptional regulator / antitoxin HigA